MHKINIHIVCLFGLACYALCSYEGGMPYAFNFPANELGKHKKVCLIGEYALSQYMRYMRVDCTCFSLTIIDILTC